MNKQGVKLLIISLITLSSPRSAIAWNEPSGFRDIPFGASEQEIKQKLPRAYCHDREITLPKALPERYCTADVTIGEVGISVRMHLRSGQFTALSFVFKSDEFNAMEGAFIEKYGKPTNTKEEPGKTRGGLEFVNRTIEWRGQRVNIRLERYSTNITYGSADIKTVEEERILIEQVIRQEKSGAKDL